MKKIIFGALIAVSLASCSSATEEVDNTAKKESIKELEKVTNEVSEGMNEMGQKADSLSSEIDALLTDI